MDAGGLTLGVTLAVLAAGLLHAGWNALLKSRRRRRPAARHGDGRRRLVGVRARWCCPSCRCPIRGAWPFVASSALIHFGYYVTLAQAYRTGDLSFAYPLMRGTAPLLVTLLGIVFLRELAERRRSIVGIVLICAGIVGIAFARRGRHSAGRGRLGARQRRDHRRLHAGRRRRRARVRQRAELRRCG